MVNTQYRPSLQDIVPACWPHCLSEVAWENRNTDERINRELKNYFTENASDAVITIIRKTDKCFCRILFIVLCLRLTYSFLSSVILMLHSPILRFA